MKNSFPANKTENIDNATQKNSYFHYKHFLYCLQGIQQTTDKFKGADERSSINEEDEGNVCVRCKNII